MPHGKAVSGVEPVAVHGEKDAAVAVAGVLGLCLRLIAGVCVGGGDRVQKEVGVKRQALREMRVCHRPQQ